MSKITVVGAGNVGATCADILAHRETAHEVVLLDINEKVAQGKALDIKQKAPIDRFYTQVVGTSDYKHTEGSEVCVITSGLPRKEGMSRSDLVLANAKVIEEVVPKLLEKSPDAILLIVTNPLDTMTYVAHQVAGIDRKKIIGMAGLLDTARFRAFISEELKITPKDIQTILMGGHGDTMVPLINYTTVGGIPITHFLGEKKLNELMERTKLGGGELVKLMGTSAWYAPGAAAAKMVRAIMKNQQRILPACVFLQGEYKFHDICMGVPVVLGRNGIERIIELHLNVGERELLNASAENVASTIEVWKNKKA